jgi:glycine C-acetyltransferase
MDDTILYPSCFDANAGLFEAVLTDEDAVISDALNHASIIDGIRLCKAQRHRYDHLDMTSLENGKKVNRIWTTAAAAFNTFILSFSFFFIS